MSIVYSGPTGGFVSDAGGPLKLTSVATGDTLTIPRYGVWRYTGRRHEVVLTTDDLDEAIKEAQR